MNDCQAHQSQTGPRDEGGLLSVNEVAVMLEVSKMSVYRLIAAGLIPSFRIGRANWLPRAAVNQFLRDVRSTGAWPPPPAVGVHSGAGEFGQSGDGRHRRPPDSDIIDEYSV